MPKVDRQADVEWKGNLIQGAGIIKRTTSGALSELPISWAARTESPNGKTSPEELLAAAHAACFAMAFSNTLSKEGYMPEALNVTAICTFEPPTITTMRLNVTGRVPGLDQQQFQRIAEEAQQGCPVSNALRNNLDMQVTTRLQS